MKTKPENDTPKVKLKTAKRMGIKVSYVPTRKNEKLTGQLFENIKATRKRCRAVAAARAKVAPPDLTPKDCLVAFIDILGFGSEIKRAATAEELRVVYDKIKTVQRIFQKESASDDPEDQRNRNEMFGRRVIALSDAVVVVYSKESPARSEMGAYDHFGAAISELIFAQTLLIQNHGIFIRGGISMGSFFFDDDILLSPAAARAYEVEAECAEFPVIALTEETRNALLGQPDKAEYAPGSDITEKAFRRHGRRKSGGQKVYFLDYLASFDSHTDSRYSAEHLKQLKTARRRRDHRVAEKIEDACFLKGMAAMRDRHRIRLETAYRATSIEKVRRKYRWLMRYHNKTFATTHKLLRKSLIRLDRFRPSVRKGVNSPK